MGDEKETVTVALLGVQVQRLQREVHDIREAVRDMVLRFGTLGEPIALVEQRVGGLERRFTALEQRLDAVVDRLDRMSERQERQFEAIMRAIKREDRDG